MDTEPINKKLKGFGGVLVGFNTNIDGIIPVDGKFQKLIDGCRPDEILKRIENPPGKINSKEDLLAGLLRCVREGIAEEWLIEEPEVFSWVKKEIGCREFRMGGQAGIMANNLARLGLKNIIVHSARTSPKQVGLFEKPVLINGSKHPVKKGDDEIVHWIFEFSRGLKLNVNSEPFECLRDNRFIATFDEPNSSLQVNQQFVDALPKFQKKLKCAIISGFHLASSQARLEEAAKIIIRLRKENPKIRIHLEMGSTKNIGVRNAIVNTILPFGDSLGLNERELADILESLNEEELAAQIREMKYNVLLLFRGAKKVFDSLKLKRIHLHTLGFYIEITDKSYAEPENSFKSLVFASKLAASIASGSKKLGEERQMEGIVSSPVQEIANFNVIIVPVGVVQNPGHTVGLGDIISSTAFVIELAMS